MVPVIEVVPMGNFANRFIQYCAALKLQSIIAESVLSNINLPEVGIKINKIETDADENSVLTIYDDEIVDAEIINALFRRKAIRVVRLWNYCQRIDLMPPLETIKQALLPLQRIAKAAPIYDHRYIVINIRANEILRGILHYPLVPVGFYQEIVHSSGKHPVFMGQIGNNEYVDELKRVFPDATFHSSLGLESDFELMRQCSHLVVSASTFTWLAALVSNAEIIDLPMIGFFNRSWMPEIDLLPLADNRFRFWRFPLYFGMPVQEFMFFQGKLNSAWQMQSPSKIKKIVEGASLIRSKGKDEAELAEPSHAQHFFENDYKPNVARGPYNALFLRKNFEERRLFDFDFYFYCHEYIDAAIEISDGWYESAAHHYASAGRFQGKRPRQANNEKISHGKESFLSSVMDECQDGLASVQARRFCNGEVRRGYAFRTKEEIDPWWKIDLGCEHVISDLYLWQRDDALGFSSSSVPLDIEFSDDGIAWCLMHRCYSDMPFGDDGSLNPFRWYPRPSLKTRFIRLIVRRQSVFQLRSIEIRGCVC